MELKFILESILFSAQKPMSPKEIRDVLAGAVEFSDDDQVKALKKTKADAITETLESLATEHETAERSYRLVCVAGSWQFVTQPEFSPWIKALVGHRARAPRLSQPALETLAIVAYRQPLTRAEIEQVRGVAVDGVMATLIDRGLVEQVGQANLPGRPRTYGTTTQFLEYFGLKDLNELPASDELRRVVVEKPESLLTVDPGLATASPDLNQVGGDHDDEDDEDDEDEDADDETGHSEAASDEDLEDDDDEDLDEELDEDDDDVAEDDEDDEDDEEDEEDEEDDEDDEEDEEASVHDDDVVRTSRGHGESLN